MASVSKIPVDWLVSGDWRLRSAGTGLILWASVVTDWMPKYINKV